MSNYIIDASAWIEYLSGTSKGKKVAEYFSQNSNKCYTNAVTVAEVISKVKRSSMDIAIAFDAIKALSIPFEVTAEFSLLVGQLHAEQKKKNKKFSFGDAFALQTAKSVNGKVVTLDMDFRGVPEVIMI